MGARTTRELLDAMSHSLGEEAVRAIFDRNKGKAKREEHTKEDAPDRFSKKKNKKGPGGSLITAAKRKGGRAPDSYPPDFFEKKLDGPCPNHAYPVKHAYKDCSLIRRFLSNGSKRKEGRDNRCSQPKVLVEGRVQI